MPKSPEKDSKETSKERARSNSVTSPAPAPGPVPANRKRTSSGVFQVDETEPPPKKPEVARTAPETPRKRPELNGKDQSEKDAKKAKQEKKVIERFDEDATTKCVSAFKESDSWD